MSDNDNSSDGVGVMSGSDSDSEMSEEDKTVADDMFADIFTDTINVTELDAIIHKESVGLFGRLWPHKLGHFGNLWPQK